MYFCNAPSVTVVLTNYVVSSPQPPNIDKATLWKIIVDILTEPTPRQKLDHINSLDDVVELLRGSKNIIVLTGAGVCKINTCKY